MVTFLARATALIALATLPACGGPPETAAKPDTASVAEPSAREDGTTSSAPAPVPPAELPDPCTLLSAEAASTLGASPGLRPTPAKAEM